MKALRAGQRAVALSCLLLASILFVFPSICHSSSSSSSSSSPPPRSHNRPLRCCSSPPSLAWIHATQPLFHRAQREKSTLPMRRSCSPAPSTLSMSDSSTPPSPWDEPDPHTFFDLEGKADEKWAGKGQGTRYANAGRRTKEFMPGGDGRSVVNPPVIRASTVTFPSVEAWKEGKRFGGPGVSQGMWYGRYGTMTQRSLEASFAHVQGGMKAVALSTPLAASICAILSMSNKNSKKTNVAVSEGVTGGVAHFCDRGLPRLGKKAVRFSDSGEGIEEVLRGGDTFAVYVAGPCPPHFRVADLSSVSSAAKAAGSEVIFDSSWGGPVIFSPFEHGAGIVVCSGSTLSGSPNDEIGLITSEKRLWRFALQTSKQWGTLASPDVSFMTLRGTRTLPFRAQEQDSSARQVARWIEDQQGDLVSAVWHPSLESHPDHKLWERQYTGAGPSFGFTLGEEFRTDHHLSLLMDHLKVLSIGYAVGGDASCIYPFSAEAGGVERGEIVLYIGLEGHDAVIGDLEQGFERLRKSRA